MSSHIRLCLLVVLFSFLLAPLSAAGSGRVLFPHACSREAGTGSRSHERALDRLNGRRIVFVGDSVSRYQYLELAYFAIYGVCPDQKAAPEYILSAYSAGFHEETRWPSFYNSSTSQLNFKGDVRWSKETCFCARTDLAPGKVFENRAFEYQDSEGRQFALHYIQYFTEAYTPFSTTMQMATATNPTDVLVNTGVWLENTNPSCMNETLAPNADPNPDFNPGCPSVGVICGLLRSVQPYKIWWQATTPVLKNGTIISPTPTGHHYNIPEQCHLAEDQIIDRSGMLYLIQPNAGKLPELWWDESDWGRSVHFHEEANHAFNAALLAKFEPRPPAVSHTIRGLWARMHPISVMRRQTVIVADLQGVPP